MRSKFDEWVYVLKHSSVKSEFTAAGVQAASEKLDILKMTDQEREDYEREKKFLHDLKMQKYTAELKAKKEGEAIGLEKGEAIGLEKGFEKGTANAIEQVVIDAKKNGFTIVQIKLFSKLTEQQIIDILKKHGLM